MIGVEDEFAVRGAIYHLDWLKHPSRGISTIWNRFFPIKINTFMWRLILDRLPTIMDFVRRGVEIDSFLCPYCLEVQENVNHIFLNCNLAHQQWLKLTPWMDKLIPIFPSTF